MQLVWEIFSEELYMANKVLDLKIHLFLLMNNHFHLICSTPKSNISQCMHQFMKNSSFRLTRAGNRINQTFAGRHYKTILQSHSYFLNAYKYNYRNPVEAKMLDRIENYPYSTLYGLLGNKKMLIPVEEDLTLFSSVEQTLNWLNTPIETEKLSALKLALRRPYFKSRICVKTNKPIIGIGDVI